MSNFREKIFEHLKKGFRSKRKPINNIYKRMNIFAIDLILKITII